jgi:hypothetical protein
MFDKIAGELQLDQSAKEALYDRTFADALDETPEPFTEETLAEFCPGIRELTAA